MTAATCPSREMLLGYLTGTIPETSADQIAEHLNHCARCEQTVRELETHGDTVMAALRQPARNDAPAAGPDFQRVLEQIHQMKPGREDSATAHCSPAVAKEPHQAPTLGDYELLKKLGQGGMGTVYKAQHKKLKRIVALKVLPKDRLRNAEAVARFEREMEAVGRLDHPHIIRAMDAREIDGIHFLVMEYVEGLDLSQIVYHYGALSIADACEVIRQAAMGLQCSHENDLVHRDIKPSNLMLTTAGEVKMLDLGLAQIHEAQGSDGQITGTDQVMGTPDYMSPEQALGSHNVDIRTDIYSLGCALYHLLAGRVPFSGPQYNSSMKKLLAHVHDEPPAIEFVRADVPKPVAALIERMVAKAPGDRLPSPVAVIDALSPFCEGSKLISLLREAHRKEQPAAKPEVSRVETGELRASMEAETNHDVPGMSQDVEHTDHGAEIDPYHVWLGIPRKEQPPDYYRLLGIARFEANLEVIRDGAARQMAHVRTYHLGQHAELSQKILNELAAAKACLLNPAMKSAYDARLRKNQQAAERNDLPHVQPDLPDWLAEDAQAAPSIPAPPASFRANKPPGKYAVAAAGLAAFVVLMGIILFVSTAKGRVKIVLNDPQANVEVQVDGAGIEIARLDEPLVLQPGEHELTVNGANYEAVRKAFTVRRSDTTMLEVTLVPVAFAPAVSAPELITPATSAPAALTPAFSAPKPLTPADSATTVPEISLDEKPSAALTEGSGTQAEPSKVSYEELAKGPWVSLSSPPDAWKPLKYQWRQVANDNGVYDITEGGLGYRATLADVALRAKVKQLLGYRTTLTLRDTPQGSYFADLMVGGTVRICRSGGDEGWKELGRAPTGASNDTYYALKFSAVYHELTFSAVGDILTVFLDGRLVLQVRDGNVQSGGVSFIAGDQGARALFKDLEILDLSPKSRSGVIGRHK